MGRMRRRRGEGGREVGGKGKGGWMVGGSAGSSEAEGGAELTGCESRALVAGRSYHRKVEVGYVMKG